MNRSKLAAPIVALAFAVGSAIAGDQGSTEDAPGIVTALADQYYDWALARTPELAYFKALDVERHDGMFDNSPAARQAGERQEDRFLARLSAIDETSLRGRPEWITYVLLSQRLRTDIATRICRSELWAVNQMGGWQLAYSQVARLQPVDRPVLREQALARWSRLPDYIDQEIANLKAGLEAGYSAPKTVVQRVVDQVDGLLALPLDESPFYSPALRAGDECFAEQLAVIVSDDITPALQRYRAFLDGPYREAARSELSVTANPNGLACYEASIRGYTTLDRSGREVYELGQRTVEANRLRVVELGRAAYDLDDLAEIVAAAKADPADHFADSDELLAFSKDTVQRASEIMAEWVGRMPGQRVEVVSFPPQEEGTGRSAHYRPGSDERPGEYRIPLHNATGQSKGNAEATAFHEAWPGHHLQTATAREIDGLHPVTNIIWFSGPGEGWARYSEALAEEMGLYRTQSGPILRRAWPARGMVVDPGLHLFGWSREQAVAFMSESGRFAGPVAEDTVDRIAMLPGQLTAYDSGGLEIIALRKQAEDAFGADFDIREFHDRILENGTIPLGALRLHVNNWIAAQAPRTAP